MHDILRERLWRNLEALPEEQLYQVLDYIEFLGSKYARDGVRPPASSLQRFGERLEDKLRGQRLGMSAIRGTMTAVGTADRLFSGITETGRTLLRDVVGPDGTEQTVVRSTAPPAAGPSRPAPAAVRPSREGTGTPGRVDPSGSAGRTERDRPETPDE